MEEDRDDEMERVAQQELRKVLKNGMRDLLNTPWRERMVQADPRRGCRKWGELSEHDRIIYAVLSGSPCIAVDQHSPHFPKRVRARYRRPDVRFYRRALPLETIERNYRRERNRYGVNTALMAEDPPRVYNYNFEFSPVTGRVYAVPELQNAARVEVTVTPGEYHGPDVSIVAGLAWRGSLPDDPAILYFGEAKKEPHPLEPLATPPWEKP